MQSCLPPTPYEQFKRTSVLDLVSRGLSVDEANQPCVYPSHPMVGWTASPWVQRERAGELSSYRHTYAQHYHFQGDSMRSRILWLSVAARCEPVEKRWRSMLLCGSSLMLQHSPSTEQYRLTVPSCGNRFCPRCGRVIARQRVAKVRALVEQQPVRGLKFLTISPSHVDQPLHLQLDHLRSSFRRLRQQKTWREAMLHGCCVIEVKIGHDGLWHPHLHIIADGNYVPHRQLLDCCRLSFGRECSVDIRRIRDPKRAADYVSKYIAKSCNDEAALARDHARADELYQSMYRSKTCWAWGKTAPRPAKEQPKRLPASDWTSILPFGQIALAVARDCREVIYMLEAACAPIDSIRRYISRGG
jgi:hypothetical protein